MLEVSIEPDQSSMIHQLPIKLINRLHKLSA